MNEIITTSLGSGKCTDASHTHIALLAQPDTQSRSSEDRRADTERGFKDMYNFITDGVDPLMKSSHPHNGDYDDLGSISPPKFAI